MEETLDARVAHITENTKGFEAEGHEGTWYTFDQKVYQGETFFQMRHERYGSEVADIIVSCRMKCGIQKSGEIPFKRCYMKNPDKRR